MAKFRAEEQFPLLLFFVGDSREFSRDNRRFFGRGRFDGITSGASNVITEWPNYISTCWITTMVCGLTLFIMSLMLLVTMSAAGTHRLPRCVNTDTPDNKTIHLIHGANKWTHDQLQVLEKVAMAFPNYTIHLISVRNKNRPFRKDNEIPKEATTNTTTNNGRSIFLKVLFGNSTIARNENATIESFIDKFPSIVLITYQTYDDIFDNSPLFRKWPMLSNPMRILAARVLQLWQFGGLSFDLMKKFPSNNSSAKYDAMITDGRRRYEKMAERIVSVDDEGFHMETKTPCHSFFGKVLMDIAKLGDRRPRTVLKNCLSVFCKMHGADLNYC